MGADALSPALDWKVLVGGGAADVHDGAVCRAVTEHVPVKDFHGPMVEKRKKRSVDLLRSSCRPNMLANWTFLNFFSWAEKRNFSVLVTLEDRRMTEEERMKCQHFL